jgi:hypothetical protein
MGQICLSRFSGFIPPLDGEGVAPLSAMGGVSTPALAEFPPPRLRQGKVGPPHEGEVLPQCQLHRSAVLSAAAAASGASTMLARLNAQSMRSGGQGEAGPMIAADAAATPKISTGT